MVLLTPGHTAVPGASLRCWQRGGSWGWQKDLPRPAHPMGTTAMEEKREMCL